MADFYQTGIITTLHKLGTSSLERLELELQVHVRTRPVTLVLPALYSEFEGKAMPRIVEELAKVKYVHAIVLILARASEKDFQKAREFMDPIPYEVKVIHNDGKRVLEIYDTIRRNGLDPGADGKGRSAWLAYGYVIGSGQSYAIALHDCDIVTYSRAMLGFSISANHCSGRWLREELSSRKDFLKRLWSRIYVRQRTRS